MDHLKIVIVKSLELSLIICQNWQLDLFKWDFSCEHNKIAKKKPDKIEPSTSRLLLNIQTTMFIHIIFFKASLFIFDYAMLSKLPSTEMLAANAGNFSRLSYQFGKL